MMNQLEDRNTEVKNKETKFEEMESVEELGNTKDYLTGVGVGVGIVVGIVALT